MSDSAAFTRSTRSTGSAPPSLLRRAAQALVRLDRHLIRLGDPRGRAREDAASEPAPPRGQPQTGEGAGISSLLL